MDEGQGLGMKGKSSDRIVACVVFAVTCHWMADPLRMSSDLVLSSCFKTEFHACVLLTVLFRMTECAAMACGEFPVLAWRPVSVVSFVERVAMDLQ